MIQQWCDAFPEILSADLSGSTPPGATSLPVDVLAAQPPQSDDRYLVRRAVGSGATGTALIGHRERDGLPIIAKIVDFGEMDENQRIRTNQEIECLSRCHNSAIIQYLAHHISGSKLLVVMELADAGDLGFQIKHRRETKCHFMEQEVALMVTQILMALEYIHSQGILHRDIKPANVFVKTNGLVKVGDFGLSKIFEETLSRPVADSLVGTPYYLAPEVWRREKYGKKADMFSVGVLWYEMLTLERPFRGGSVTAVMKAITEGSIPPLPQHISPETGSVVQRLLSVNPDDRPSILEVFELPLMDHSLRIFSSVIVENLPLSPEVKKAVQGDALVLRRKIQQHVEEKRAAAAAATPSVGAQPPPSVDLASLAFTTPIVYLEDGKKWKHRAMRLTAEGELQIARNVDAFQTQEAGSQGTSGTPTVLASQRSASTSQTSGTPVSPPQSGGGSSTVAAQSAASSATGASDAAPTARRTPALLRAISVANIFYTNDVPPCMAEGRPHVFAVVLRETDEALWFYSAVSPAIAADWRRRLEAACAARAAA